MSEATYDFYLPRDARVTQDEEIILGISSSVATFHVGPLKTTTDSEVVGLSTVVFQEDFNAG
jgi:hypothetical protein